MSKTMRRISVLSDYFLSEQNINHLRELGEVTVYTNTNTEETTIKRLHGATIAIADGFLTPLSKKTLQHAKDLKLLVLNTTTKDVADIAAAEEMGIEVRNTPGYATQSVAESTIGLIFDLARKISLGDRLVRKQPFVIDPLDPIQREALLGFELSGKTLGIVGLGAIGSKVARMAKGLGMKVVAYNRTPKKHHGVEMVALDEVFAMSDVVSLHLTIGESTAHIIGAQQLALMSKHAVLVNTAGSKLVDMLALYNSLKNGRIQGAAFEVFPDWEEVPRLYQLDNVVLTPLTAWYTQEALINMGNIVIKNVESFVNNA